MRSGDELAGRYVLKEVVGAGRSGDVWLAHDTVVGQDVAVKPERIAGDHETAMRRLLGEPRALAKFRDHPHVVTLFDVVPVGEDGEEADTYWFIMEYVPGGGLDRQPAMPPDRAARIGAQLADALAALHEAGIVHCDVKPANIGLSRRRTAKLLDFGAAYRAGGAETVTANGPFSFTPDYAAPELARGNTPQPASDVFCLAATLYALVTGSPPRGDGRAEERDGRDGQHGRDGQEGVRGAGGEGDDTERLRYWKAERGVVEMDADAVGPLHPVLTAMLQRDPQRRPDAVEAQRLLEAVAGPTPDGDSTDGPTQGGRPGRLRGRRPLIAAAALGLSAALALGVALLPGDDGDAPKGGENGKPHASGGESGGGTKSRVGDPRTADICALNDPAALERFGDAQVDVDYGNFDRCDVLVHPDEKSRIDVSVYLRTGSPPEGSKPGRSIGDVGIMEEQPESDECGLLLLPENDGDDTLVGIRVEMGDGSVTGGSATLCAVADEAARSAAEVLNKGPVPRRSPAYADASLAWSNACELLDTKALSAVSGLKADDPEVGVANWSCEWSGDDADELEAEVAFFRDQPKSAAEGRSLRLSGYDAVVEPEGDGDKTCTVFVEYREYSNHNAETAAEMLRLHVDGQRSMKNLCDAATALATSAAAELRAR